MKGQHLKKQKSTGVNPMLFLGIYVENILASATAAATAASALFCLLSLAPLTKCLLLRHKDSPFERD